MGIGDRHSRRTAAIDKTKIAAQRSYIVDDRELDDAFSAWDENDAGAHRPSHPSPAAQLAVATTSSLATTRIERRATSGPAPIAQIADALVDPVAMRDIVISRARTLDDPLTTRVLAEIARSAVGDRAPGAPLAPRTRTQRETVKMKPFVPAEGTRDEPRTPMTDAIAVEPAASPAGDAQDLAAARRRPTKRSIARDEPFRKKER